VTFYTLSLRTTGIYTAVYCYILLYTAIGSLFSNAMCQYPCSLRTVVIHNIFPVTIQENVWWSEV